MSITATELKNNLGKYFYYKEWENSGKTDKSTSGQSRSSKIPVWNLTKGCRPE